MKILVFSYRLDEEGSYERFRKKYNVDIVLCNDKPSMENYKLAEGFDCISIVTTPISAELVEKFYEVGVKYISTRTIGFDHICLEKAKELGMSVGNVNYSPNSVADYTIMMILMITRKMKLIMDRCNVQDFSLKEVRGREIPNMTIGIIGTGKIGETVIKHLSGFGCKVLAYDLYKKDNLKGFAEYVSLDKLICESDVITMHVPATEDNYHLINKESICKMKDNVFIINTSRGSLINTFDLIDALESGKVAGAALDVIENESSLYYSDLKAQVINNRELAILRSFPNVIITPHTAFYTDEAVSDMVENSIKSCIAFVEGKNNPWQVI